MRRGRRAASSGRSQGGNPGGAGREGSRAPPHAQFSCRTENLAGLDTVSNDWDHQGMITHRQRHLHAETPAERQHNPQKAAAGAQEAQTTATNHGQAGKDAPDCHDVMA
jgi:hypothetical protein